MAYGQFDSDFRLFFALTLYYRQLVTNCRTGKADQALSFWFLMQWLLGDVTNWCCANKTAAHTGEGEREREREREGGEREKERGERGWKSLLDVIMCDFATKSRRT